MILTAIEKPVGPLVGHIELTASGVPSTAVTVSVQRTAQGRTMDVRGAFDMRVDGAMFVRDFEAGFGVATTYTAVALNSAGAVVDTVTVAAERLRSRVSGSVTIHDPVRPRDAITLTLRGSAAQAGVRPLNGDAINIPGRSLPVVVSAGRQGWSGFAFDVYTYLEEQSEQLDAMLGGYDSDRASGVLCFRVTENLPSQVPRTFFGFCPEPSVSWVRIGDKIRGDWSLTAVEVAPPAAALVEPVVTWGELSAYWNEHGGWAAFNAAYATQADVSKDLRPLGAA